MLGLSLGRSAIYALVNIIERATRGPLGEQTASLNTSQSARPVFDFIYQLLSIGFALLPVVLVLFLLAENGVRSWRILGLDFTQFGRDIGWGFALAAIIGVPGLGIYLLGRELGVTVEVSAAGLSASWWAVLVLCLAALKNGLVEEVIAVGYLDHRLRLLEWSVPVIVLTSSVLRGAYHLYQGWGPFVANIAMGLVLLAFYYSRFGRRRVMPLVLAHTIIDVVAFVGYAALPASMLAALGLTSG